jgi:hypothetical protein
MSELQPDEVGARPVTGQVPKARRTLALLKRELSDEELSSPVVGKMLVEELERAEEEIVELKTFRDKFTEADKRVAVQNEKLKGNVAIEIISTGCIAAGAAALVYAPEAWKSQPNGWISVIFGGVLTIAGIVAKAIRL